MAARANCSGLEPCSWATRCRISLSRALSCSLLSGVCRQPVSLARMRSSLFWLMVALLGTSISAIGLATTRSSPPRKRRSRGVRNRMASPVRPARPVRPMRCT